MIEKSNVIKIITLYSQLPNSKHIKIENLLKGRSIEWLALRDFIASLSNDELWDLVALTDYGRDHYNMKNMSRNKMEYIQKRQSIKLQMKTSEDKQHIASYLLQKSQLSEYLQYSLPLFEDEF